MDQNRAAPESPSRKLRRHREMFTDTFLLDSKKKPSRKRAARDLPDSTHSKYFDSPKLEKNIKETNKSNSTEFALQSGHTTRKTRKTNADDKLMITKSSKVKRGSAQNLKTVESLETEDNLAEQSPRNKRLSSRTSKKMATEGGKTAEQNTRSKRRSKTSTDTLTEKKRRSRTKKQNEKHSVTPNNDVILSCDAETIKGTDVRQMNLTVSSKRSSTALSENVQLTSSLQTTGDLGENGKVMEDSTDDSGSEWEEVEELPQDDLDDDAYSRELQLKSQLPDKPIQITLELPSLDKTKRKRGAFDWRDWLRQQFNRYKKKTQEETHKVHLLCLLSHGQNRNNLCRNQLLTTTALSLTPVTFLQQSVEHWNEASVQNYLDWFKQYLTVDDDIQKPFCLINEESLLQRMRNQRAHTLVELNLLFVLFCRALGFATRLIFSLRPVSFKPTDLILKTAKKAKTAKLSTEADVGTEAGTSRDTTETMSKTEAEKKKETACERKLGKTRAKNTQSKEVNRTTGTRKSCQKKKKSVGNNSNCETIQEIRNDIQNTEVKDTEEASRDRNLKQQSDVAGSTSELNKGASGAIERRRSCRRNATVNYAEGGGSANDDDADDDDFIVDDKYSKRRSGMTKDVGLEKQTTVSADSDSSSDVQVLSEISKPSARELQRRRRSVRKMTLLSFDLTENSPDLNVRDVDWWSEIYLSSEENWLYVNVSSGVVAWPQDINEPAMFPLSYILAFDADGSVKDITKKYCSRSVVETQKLRLDDDWWHDVLSVYKTSHQERDKKENLLIEEHLCKQPLPTTIMEYKNHPLYVLQRHLLKFEGIYPPTACVLGYIKNEPVYARECVHTLHSRETWLKEGLAIKLHEEPYKMVRARPKWWRPEENTKEPTLPLYGRWQTEKYIPEPAVDGKIPKNGYGNVELFQEWMLPEGTLHLKGYPGLNRVARKLSLDVAPAMIGWDFHSGVNVPVHDGWVVCIEHKEALVAAWEEEQALQIQKELEKRQQKVIANWRLLTRGLLIKQRLKRRYNLEDKELKSDEKEKMSGKKTTEIKKATDDKLYWPRNIEARGQRTLSTLPCETEFM